MQYRLTWLAIILTFLFLVPGEVVGHIFAFLYRFVVSGLFFSGNTIFDMSTRGWFSRIGSEGVASGIQGLVAALSAAWVCDKITNSADFRIVAYSNTALVAAITAFGLFTSYAQAGLGMNNFVIVANTVGLVAGLFVAAEHLREKQNERRRMLDYQSKPKRAAKS
jgi:general stress protein CsbA